MGIAGMVLGIVALVFVWIPFVGVISIPLIIVGLPLSGVALYQGRQNETGTGMAIAGLVTNAIALIVVIVYMVVLGSFISALS